MIVLLRIILNISTRPKYKRYKKINRKPSGHKKITKKIISLKKRCCQIMSKCNICCLFFQMQKCTDKQLTYTNSNINCHFAYIYTVPLPKHLRVRDLLEVKYLGKDNEICKLQSCKCSLELTHIFDKSTIDTGITLLFTKILQKETEFLQQTLIISFKSDVVDLYFLKL